MIPFFENKIGLWAHVTDSLVGNLHTIQGLGFDYLVVKVADGAHAYDPGPLPQLRKDAVSIGLPVVPWAYVYPSNIDAQIEAIAGALSMSDSHLILDAESEWEKPGTDSLAEQLAHGIAEATAHRVTLHLSSFYAPSLHPAFPFAAFLRHCGSWMPQSYDEGGRTDAQILARTALDAGALEEKVPGIVTIPTVNTPGLVSLLRTAGYDAGSVWLWDGVALPPGSQRKPGQDMGVRGYEFSFAAALEAFRKDA